MTAERDEARLLLHARLDGELDAAEALKLERKLASDPKLRAEAETLAALRGALRETVPQERAPDALRRAILMKTAPPRPGWRADWRSVAAAALVSAGLGGGGAWLAFAPDAESGAFESVIAGHARALAASRPTDLSSSDRHAIKPWFNGRVTFAPRVFDLTEEGFPLVGGRVDIVDGRPAATLVYRRRQHLISLTANPEPVSGAPFSGSLRGYSLLGWRDDGVAYRAVSDLGPGEMNKFADLFRARAKGR